MVYRVILAGVIAVSAMPQWGHDALAQGASWQSNEEWTVDWKGERLYEVTVTNTGSVPIRCSVAISGLYFPSGFNPRQERYSGGGTVIVRPGRTESYGVSRLQVAAHEVICEEY